jgi:hypothetical protein
MSTMRLPQWINLNLESKMADAYGVVTFTRSEDCQMDIEGLRGILNQFSWDTSGAKWEITESESLCLDTYVAQYPTAIPAELKDYVSLRERGAFYEILRERIARKNWDNEVGEIEVPTALEILTQIICPLMQSGYIEIACVANEKMRYVYFESLHISADRNANWRRNCSGPWVQPTSQFEELIDQKH